MVIAFVVGVPGVGKSSVVREALKYVASEYRVINFGDYVLQVVRDKYRIEDRDLIRKKLDKEEYILVQEEAARKIKAIADNENVIIDTHLFIETPFGFYSGAPEVVTRTIKPDLIAIITAPPEQILMRRLSDKSRNRDIDDIETIKLQQDLTVMHAVLMAYHFGTYIDIIENLDGRLEIAGKRLADLLKNIANEL